MTIRIFISYSHLDDAHRIRLQKHMAPLLREKDVDAWFDGDIEPGKAITPEIRKALRETDIFLALGSSNYLDSDYCYRMEYRPMLRRSKQGRPRVVVALVGICDWPNTEMARSKMLPNDAKSVEQHGQRNKAYLEIVQGLRRVVRSVRQEKGKAQAEKKREAADKAGAVAGRRKATERQRDEVRVSKSQSEVGIPKPRKPKLKSPTTSPKPKTGRTRTKRSVSVRPKAARTTKPRLPPG